MTKINITETPETNEQFLYQFELTDGRTAFIEPFQIDHSNPEKYHSFEINSLKSNELHNIKPGIISLNDAFQGFTVLPFGTKREDFFLTHATRLILDGFDIDRILRMESEFDYRGHNVYQMSKDENGWTRFRAFNIERNYSEVNGWYIGIIKDEEVKNV